MADRSKGKNGRRFERLHWRVPCSFRYSEITRRGFVTDLSPSGLFVHTSVNLETGAALLLTLDTDEYPPIVLSGRIVRNRQLHRNASMVSQDGGGVGIKLESAPEEYYRLVVELSEKNS